MSHRQPKPASLTWLVMLALTLGWHQMADGQPIRPESGPRIGVMTMQAGSAYFERFGHDALIVQDPHRRQAISYNFGFFDPDEPGFLRRFARGTMRYSLVALPLEIDLQTYRDEGRGVRIQWLNLPADQALTIARTLARRSQPDLAHYRYNYFTANCATQVRDTLNQAMGGQLARQLAQPAPGLTYRRTAVPLTWPIAWLWAGVDFVLGPRTDRPLTQWQSLYLPDRLANALAEAHNTAGQPLVQDHQWLLPAQPQSPISPPSNAIGWLLGMTLACCFLVLAAHQPPAYRRLAAGLWFSQGVIGSFLIGLWIWSQHQFTWVNHNLLLCHPLCWVLWLAKDQSRWRYTLVTLHLLNATLSGLALILSWTPLGQANGFWIGVMAPSHWILAREFGRSFWNRQCKTIRPCD